jgi:23S rRNA pseudouridine2604 synthase
LRINKYISEAGVCSRRQADAWIEAGRVSVNGVTAVLGTKVAPGDVVSVDGKPVGAAKKHVYIALNKPVGIFVGYPERIYPIGRLDKNSQGLILLTNNGDIVNEILRAANGHEKEYVVTVDKEITDQFLKDMSRGVRILDTVTNPCKVWRTTTRTFRIILTQGLNRQIRRMCKALGYRVTSLQRVRIINLKLGDLQVGRWRKLQMKEVRALLPHKPEEFF